MTLPAFGAECVGETTVRIDPAVGAAVIAPSISVDGDELRFDWPSRPGRVAVQSHDAMRASPSRQRSGRAQRTPVQRSSAVGRRSRDERHLIRAVDHRDLTLIREMASSSGPLSSAATVLLALLDHDLRAAETALVDELSAAETAAVCLSKAEPVLSQLFSIRCLVPVAPGVMARSPVSPSLLAIVAANSASDPAAIGHLEANPVPAHQAVALVTRLQAAGRHSDVDRLTSDISNIDPWTALLCIARARSLHRSDLPRVASAGLTEAMRLARTPSPVVVQALLERARLSLRDGRRKRCIADLERAAGVSAIEIAGLPLALRRLRARR